MSDVKNKLWDFCKAISLQTLLCCLHCRRLRFKSGGLKTIKLQYLATLVAGKHNVSNEYKNQILN
jgi:hypothetical protein